MLNKPLTVAWISDFPIEWLPNPPDLVSRLPRRHPATWQMVLRTEFEKNPDLKLHIILLRHRIERGFTFQQEGTVFHVLKAPPWARLASIFWLDTLLIRRVCERIRPDLVHAWGNEKGAGLIGHRLRFPWLLTIQGLFAWYREQVPMVAYDRFAERLERIALSKAPVVTTESNFAVQYLRRRYPKLTVQQAEHAPSHGFFEVARKPQTSPVRFLAMGTLGFRKGTDLLFRALENIREDLDFSLTVITNPNPSFVERLKSSVSFALWDRVTFRHHILPHEVARELESPTMMLLPTRADVSPNAAKECVVAAVPVVASNIGGIPDYVLHGKNGTLFAPGNLGEFVGAIKSALQHPLFRQGRVAPEVLASMRNYLSPEAMARNFLSAYATAMSGGNTASRP